MSASKRQSLLASFYLIAIATFVSGPQAIARQQVEAIDQSDDSSDAETWACSARPRAIPGTILKRPRLAPREMPPATPWSRKLASPLTGFIKTADSGTETTWSEASASSSWSTL